MGKMLRQIKLELEVIKTMIGMVYEDRQPKWQTIKTAPMDGTEILLAFDPTVGSYNIGKWWKKKTGERWVCAYTHKNLHNEPTHWMALPEQPYTDEEQQEAFRVRCGEDERWWYHG